ncbi:GmrSD restriction endonuclease domain-containing protein [Streptomyces californicus]
MSDLSALDNLEEQLRGERGRVDVAVHNFSVRELVRMITEEELNASPSYQRKFRWTESDESLFVESVFLGLPIPPIFVATNVGFQWEVVDGLQRLSTLAHFLARDAREAIEIGRESPLRLQSLEKLTELNGYCFTDLPKNLQVYIGRQPLQVISLTDKSDMQARFDVFERLNRGGIQLTAQEVRACVYQGRFNDFIDELSRDPRLNDILKLQRVHQDDGTRAEQVLKFFAYKNYKSEFDGKVETFLNRYMQAVDSEFDYVAEREVFDKALEALHAVCEGQYFLRKQTPVTPLVQFEACLVGAGELVEEGIPFGQVSPDWLEDAELRASTGAGTNTRSMLRRRVKRAKELLSGTA